MGVLPQVALNAGSGSLDKAPIFTPVDTRRNKLTRFNPLQGFSPALLATHLASFEAGYLHQAARLWQAMARRDDILSSVKTKRDGAVTLRSWGIRSTEEATTDKGLEKEAESQTQRLKYFWNNVRCVNAFDRNFSGGFAKFVEAVMQAQSYRYGALHLIWRPTPKGLSADIEYVPLEFFENLTGSLRLLRNPMAQVEGEELDPTNWITFGGVGCMEPASVGYGFKHLALNDWLSYCERYGMPFPIGETSAAYGSPEWTAMETAVDHIVNEGSAVIGAGAKISLLQAAAQGEVPMSAIVDRMDRAFSVIYRGSNLSTLSQDQKGASVQANESLILEAMDCAFVSEVMQQIECRVLEYYDGPGTEAIAYGAIKAPNLRDTRTDLDIDEKLIKWGVRISQRDALERYQREPAAEDEEALEDKGQLAPVAEVLRVSGQPGETTPPAQAADAVASNERIAWNQKARNNTPVSVHEAVLEDLAPIIEALSEVAGDEADTLAKLKALDLEALARRVLKGEALDAALLGELGQTFAEAVNLPDLITETLAAEQGTDDNNQD